MNFTTFQFIVFFLVVVGIFWAIGQFTKTQRGTLAARLFLLAASLFFYACWNPIYIFLLLASILITWGGALFMEGRGTASKRGIISAVLVINLGLLFFFKYWNFAQEIFYCLPRYNFLLPLGISFYTFQAIGYTVDVYKSRVRAERNIITYALFVTFFPQLVAGPIERGGNLLPQFKTLSKTPRKFNYEAATSGLKLIVWGFFKKLVIADRLAYYVDTVYAHPEIYTALTLITATFFFAFQIYADFSGYSDIAIGCARMLGFNLMTNFRAPYCATSLADFWRRWHISLSSWLKDYIYIPLGGNRHGAARQSINLMITFLISGLWHGAAWHFIAWGALHGILLNIEHAIKKTTAKNARFCGDALSRCATFLVICASWIFFRAQDMKSVVIIFSKITALPKEILSMNIRAQQDGWLAVLQNIFAFDAGAENNINTAFVGAFTPVKFALLILFIALLKEDAVSRLSKAPLFIRWLGYYAILISIVILQPGNAQGFIYFDF